MNTILRSFIIFLALLLCWQACIELFNLPDYILPSPIQVFVTWFTQAKLILHEAVSTVTETLLGLLFGIFLGSCTALTMTFFRPAKHWILPILLISQALPTFAIAPLLVIWFGYGMASKIATTVLMLYFPITSAFYDGLRRTPQDWLDLAKTMRAKPWRLFLHIRIPAAFPYFAAGLRVATAIAPIGAVIGEWVGASHGLGYLMLNANARMQIDLMFAALFTLVVFSLVLYLSVDKLLRVTIPWEK